MKLSHIASRFLTLLLSVVLVGMFTFEAEARRLGGGKSMGRQSSNVTQREAAPPTAPSQSSATAIDHKRTAPVGGKERRRAIGIDAERHTAIDGQGFARVDREKVRQRGAIGSDGESGDRLIESAQVPRRGRGAGPQANGRRRRQRIVCADNQYAVVNIRGAAVGGRRIKSQRPCAELGQVERIRSVVDHAADRQGTCRRRQ